MVGGRSLPSGFCKVPYAGHYRGERGRVVSASSGFGAELLRAFGHDFGRPRPRSTERCDARPVEGAERRRGRLPMRPVSIESTRITESANTAVYDLVVADDAAGVRGRGGATARFCPA